MLGAAQTIANELLKELMDAVGMVNLTGMFGAEPAAKMSGEAVACSLTPKDATFILDRLRPTGRVRYLRDTAG